MKYDAIGGPFSLSKYSPNTIYITTYLLRMSELFLQLSDARFSLFLGPCSAMFSLVPLGYPVADGKRRGLWVVFQGCNIVKTSVRAKRARPTHTCLGG